MSRIRFTLFTLTVLLFFGQQATAQNTKFVNEFLNIGVGAKAHGMFGAMTAHTDDITAGFWNPAGLSSISSPFQASAMHAEWFAGIANYDYFSIANRFDEDSKSVGSLSLIRMGVDNIPNTLNLIGEDGSVNYDEIQTFSIADYAIMIGYARALRDERWRIGGNAKVIYRSVGQFSNAWGFGLDVGVQFKERNFSVGLMGRDISTTFNSWTFNFTDEEKATFAKTGNEIPVSSTELALPKIILGGAWHNDPEDYTRKMSYLVSLDLALSTDGLNSSFLQTNRFNLDPRLGVELGYNNLVFIRAGLGNIQRFINEINGEAYSYSIQPNIGLGLRLGRVKIDYALTDIGAATGLKDGNNGSSVLYSHIFSLLIDYTPK